MGKFKRKATKKSRNSASFLSSKAARRKARSTVNQCSGNTTELELTGKVIPHPPVMKNLSMKDSNSCRRAISRMTKLLLRGEIEPELYRSILYGIQVQVSLIKVDIDRDILEIKEYIHEQKNSEPT
ncbi:hypothetical protein LCGC14_2861120 [marine sediment metagenome]|uniref:Uncharacterized protein n=1 Tax=marine sediment metagenome TaxID=412755 RepID=A0A0F9ADX4_9ZZZZ